MKRLDQGHLHPKVELPRPGIEPGPLQWEASTLEKGHSNSLFNCYSEPLQCPIYFELWPNEALVDRNEVGAVRHVEYVSGAGRRGSRGPYRLSSGDVAREPLWVSHLFLLSFPVWYLGSVVDSDPAGIFYGLVGRRYPVGTGTKYGKIIRIKLFALINSKLDQFINSNDWKWSVSKSNCFWSTIPVPYMYFCTFRSYLPNIFPYYQSLCLYCQLSGFCISDLFWFLLASVLMNKNCKILQLKEDRIFLIKNFNP